MGASNFDGFLLYIVALPVSQFGIVRGWAIGVIAWATNVVSEVRSGPKHLTFLPLPQAHKYSGSLDFPYLYGLLCQANVA